MCGIAGEINYKNQTNQTTFENMMQKIKRRGPNQEGIFQADQTTLIHTRLSVVDLEHGIQPMKAAYGDREYAIVYNGELYNTEEIREKLLNKGYHFIGHSDTEVLLKAYVEWEEACVHQLNGIFAFAIWDNSAKKLFIARDRMGVKPFFYYKNNGVFIFGSELKALLAHPQVEAKIDSNAIAEIMLIGPGRTPGYGVFHGIQELRAGDCGTYSQKNGLHIYPYWCVTDQEHTDSFAQTVERVRYLVTDAIQKQLVSDVPICTFLSGGLDSSIITAIASQHLTQKGERLSTFSVDYVDNDKYFTPSKFQPNSDDIYIEAMRQFLGVNHHKIIIGTDELVNALYRAVDARDLPGMADVDASLLLFCEQVKKHATVALSGECADEIFGGYPWYRDESIRNIDGFPWSQSTAYRTGFLRDEFTQKINPQYVYDRYLSTVRETSKADGLSPLESRMKEMTNLNLQWFMQTLLDRKDRMSMHHGLEVRVPFCDYRIVEYLYSVPWEYKDYKGREKGLLRMAMEGVLPDEVLWRKKSPYPKTHHPAYLKQISQILQEIIDNDSSPLLQFVKKSELENLLKTNREVPWYGQLMTTPQTIAYFIQINYWLEKYKIKII